MKPLVATTLNKTCLIEQFFDIFPTLFYLQVVITKIS